MVFAALRVLALQIDSSPRSVSDNLARAADLIRANPGHDLYVLPELSSCGYSDEVLSSLDEVAEDGRSGVSRQFFRSLAVETGSYIAYGIARRRAADEPECARGRFAICHAVVDPVGELLLLYDKMHVCNMGKCSEAAYGFSPGSRPGVFSCKGVSVGLSICYDIRFSELYRTLAWDRGCDLLLHPSAFVRDATFPMYHPFAQTRAVENGAYFLSVNWAGADYGSSIGVPPWVGPVPGVGEELAPASLGIEEGVLPLAVEPAHLAAVRAAYPYRRDVNRVLRDEQDEPAVDHILPTS